MKDSGGRFCRTSAPMQVDRWGFADMMLLF